MSKPTCRELLDNEHNWTSHALWDELATRVERVLARHLRLETEESVTCAECEYLWPCPTVRLLNGEEP